VILVVKSKTRLFLNWHAFILSGKIDFATRIRRASQPEQRVLFIAHLLDNLAMLEYS
jgi:hypothetical protein